MTDCDHVPFARFELKLYAMLHLFARLFCLVVEYETRAHEIGRIADAFRVSEPVEIGLFFFDLNTAHRIDAKPCGKCETILVRPVSNGWKRYALFRGGKKKFLIN